MRTLEQARVVSHGERAMLDELKRLILGFLPKATVVLYGSVARGTHHAESDFDILVLTEELLSREEEDQVEDAILNFELSHDIVITTILHSNSEWNSAFHRVVPFHQEVERDAIVL